MNFDTYFCFCFSLIFPIFPRAPRAALFLVIFFFILFLNLISWRQKYQIKFITESFVCDLFRGIKFLWWSKLWNSWLLLMQLLQVGKIKVTAKRGLKILWIHCQNSESIMTNEIKKIRLGVDQFDKRIKEFLILVSSSWTVLQNTASSLQPSFPCSRQCINWFHSVWCTTYQGSAFHFPCFWQLFSFFPCRVYCQVV